MFFSFIVQEPRKAFRISIFQFSASIQTKSHNFFSTEFFISLRHGENEMFLKRLHSKSKCRQIISFHVFFFWFSFFDFILFFSFYFSAVLIHHNIQAENKRQTIWAQKNVVSMDLAVDNQIRFSATGRGRTALAAVELTDNMKI